MSFLAGIFNGDKGSNFTANTAGITNPTDAGQLAEAHGETQSGLGQQQQFVNALQAQNGIGNQSQVYNQLQGIAAGTGPNPAQAALANATGANTSNQAALMAGQRGAGANAGLIARQAAQQGAANQQNSIGQGAALQAQQSLNAVGQAGQIAGQQVGQQAGALGTYNQLAQNNQGMQQTAAGQLNSTNVQNTSQQNSSNAGVAGVNAQAQNKVTSGIVSTLSGGLLGAAGGGMIKSYADGGPTTGALPPASSSPAGFWGLHLTGVQPIAQPGATSSAPSPATAAPGAEEKAGNDMGSLALKVGKMALLAKGGKVPAMVSPGERYLPPRAVKEVAKGKDPLKAGEKIPGKPKYKGNDYRNDVVPKTLESGGIVLPNEVMQSKNPHWAAHKFVSNIMAQQGLTPKKKAKA